MVITSMSDKDYVKEQGEWLEDAYKKEARVLAWAAGFIVAFVFTVGMAYVFITD
jgi:hypothetical protein